MRADQITLSFNSPTPSNLQQFLGQRPAIGLDFALMFGAAARHQFATWKNLSTSASSAVPVVPVEPVHPASIRPEGRAFTDEFHRYRWYFYVPLTLAIIQLVAALLLSRSRSE